MADSPGAVFISYSHRNLAFLEQFLDHLRPHVRSGAIPLWVDRQQIKPGDEWYQKIEQALESARVAILLVSVGFLASDFVADEELPKLLEKAEQRQVVVLPVILETCGFEETRLKRYQSVNPPSKPLRRMTLDERNEVWQRTVRRIREALAAAPVEALVTSEPPQTLPVVGLPALPVAAATEPAAPEPPAQDPQPDTNALTQQEDEGIVERSATTNTPRKRITTRPAVLNRPPPGTLLLTFQGHKDTVNSVAWSPDGRRLASAGQDGMVYVLDAASLQLLLACRGHEGEVYSVMWSPNGRRLASASQDKTVRVWYVG